MRFLEDRQVLEEFLLQLLQAENPDKGTLFTVIY